MVFIFSVISLSMKIQFLNLYANSINEINRKQLVLSLDSGNLKKSNNLKSGFLNWFLELLGMIKQISNNPEYSDNNVQYSLNVLFVAIYVFCQTPDITSKNKIYNVDLQHIMNDIKLYMKKFISKAHWKQIQKKLADWLINLLNSRKFNDEYLECLKGIILIDNFF